jgi:hypothetical protein
LTIKDTSQGKTMYTIRTLVGCLLLALAGPSYAGFITPHFVDFIDDDSRTHFNGFEAITAVNGFYTGGSGPYVEDTIAVQQVNGDAGNDMWVTFRYWEGSQGGFAWYPNTGDRGYTEISLLGGIDFQRVGFNYGSGGFYQTGLTSQILYELLHDGAVVLTGSADLTPNVNYLGFSGGKFDTIRVRDTLMVPGGAVTDGAYQALVIDNIEMRHNVVPEPSAFALFGIGAMSVAAVAVRRHVRGRRIRRVVPATA